MGKRRHMSERFEPLKAIIHAISTFTDLDAVLIAALETTLEALQVEGGQIRLVDPATDEPVLAIQRRQSEASGPEQARFPKTAWTVSPLKGGEEVVIIPDLTKAVEHPAYALTREGYQSYAAIPLLAHGTVVGSLSLMSRRVGWFQPDDIPFLSTIGHLLGVALRQAHLLQEAREGRERAEALMEGGRLLTSTLDPHQVLARIAEVARHMVGAQFTIVEVPEGPTFRAAAVGGDDEGYASLLSSLPSPEEAFSQGPCGRAFRTRTPVVVPDILKDPTFAPWREAAQARGIRATASVPLVHQERVLGILTAYKKEPDSFTQEQVALLTAFANQAAVALETAHHAETLEQKVLERTRELEEANRHKSEFLANMSHELRTPLNAIIGFSELLQDQRFGSLNEKQARYVKNIHRSGQHLLALINDILDFSHVEAGRLRLALQALSLAPLLEEALALIRPRALQKSLTVTVTCPSELPPVMADPGRLKQILHNLLSNAVKFTPEGGRITITTRQVTVSQGMGAGEPGSGGAEEPSPLPPSPLAPQQFIEISVADTGIGITPEDLPKLFQTFVQLEHPLTKRYEGTGLGLALTKRLVELHGGRIWAASPGQGRGSTFTFTLPIARGAEPSSPAGSNGRPWGTG